MIAEISEIMILQMIIIFAGSMAFSSQKGFPKVNQEDMEEEIRKDKKNREILKKSISKFR